MMYDILTIKGGDVMQCPKCQSTNVNVQVVNNKIKTNNTGIIHACARLTLILFTCGLWLLVPSRKENSKIKNKTVAVCQNCGHQWNIK